MKDGGSAFPVVYGHPENIMSDPGMTLRDWFAGQALAGLCAKGNWDDGEEIVLATWAYDLADAMLAAREKT